MLGKNIPDRGKHVQSLSQEGAFVWSELRGGLCGWGSDHPCSWSSRGFCCSVRVQGSHRRLYGRGVPCSVVHLEKSACFYGECTGEGKERGRKASVVAVSAAPESSDGDLDWEVMAEEAAGKDWSGALVGDPAGLGDGLHPGSGE